MPGSRRVVWNYLRESLGEDFFTVVSRSCEKRAVAERWQEVGVGVAKGSAERRGSREGVCGGGESVTHRRGRWKALPPAEGSLGKYWQMAQDASFPP